MRSSHCFTGGHCYQGKHTQNTSFPCISISNLRATLCELFLRVVREHVGVAELQISGTNCVQFHEFSNASDSEQVTLS